MGYEELVRHLIRTAEGKRDAILDRAREEAGAIRRLARERAADLERGSRDAVEREAARIRRDRMDRAAAEARAQGVRARAALAEAILSRLEARLARLPGEPRHAAAAKSLYREILPEIPAGNVVLRADDRTLAVLSPLAADPRIRFAPLPAEEIWGVEVSDEAGALRIRNTLASRLARARPALLAKIGERLSRPDE